MAKVIFQHKDDTVSTVEDVDNLTGPNATFSYWMILFKRDDTQVRRFYHVNDVLSVEVIGEEEIIESAQQGSANAEKLARQLGLDRM